MATDKPNLTAAVIAGDDDIQAYIETMTPGEALYWTGSLIAGFAHALRASGALQLRTAQKLLIHIAKTRGGVTPSDTADQGFGQLLARIVSDINVAQIVDRGEG